jgi:hypothetical protein
VSAAIFWWKYEVEDLPSPGLGASEARFNSAVLLVSGYWDTWEGLRYAKKTWPGQENRGGGGCGTDVVYCVRL